MDSVSFFATKRNSIASGVFSEREAVEPVCLIDDCTIDGRFWGFFGQSASPCPHRGTLNASMHQHPFNET